MKHILGWSVLISAVLLVAGCGSDSDNDNDGCVLGSTRCAGQKLQACNSSGNWNDVVCPKSTDVCTETVNGPTCQTPTEGCGTVGTTRCSGSSAIQTCLASGSWSDAVDCTGTAACDACGQSSSCTEGSTRCNGAALQKCSSGTWSDLACDGSCVESASGAECKASQKCTAGQTKCSDNGSQAVLYTCNDQGSWDEKPCPASDIAGARLSCRNADSCSTVICTEAGAIYNSEEKSCNTLNHSNACVAGRTYCNGKTNFLYECLETGNEAPTSATDCTKDGGVCVKLSDNEAVCMKEECNGNFCDGEVLMYCTDDHKLVTEGVKSLNCADSDRICDINEFGYGECMYPECITENEIVCLSDDNTKYQVCVNKRLGEVQTCPQGTSCNSAQKACVAD